ncbi:10342_t:CDS:2, partial [Acaulospora colombiana]
RVWEDLEGGDVLPRFTLEVRMIEKAISQESSETSSENEELQIDCPLCDATFSDHYAFTKHYTNEHARKLRNDTIDPNTGNMNPPSYFDATNGQQPPANVEAEVMEILNWNRFGRRMLINAGYSISRASANIASYKSNGVEARLGLGISRFSIGEKFEVNTP